MKNLVLILLLSIICQFTWAENGYDLWLRYKTIEDKTTLKTYQEQFSTVLVIGSSQTTKVIKNELHKALVSMLNASVNISGEYADQKLIIATTNYLKNEETGLSNDHFAKIGNEGYIITNTKYRGSKATIITANSDIGLLYGTFHLLQLMQTNSVTDNSLIIEKPKTKIRVLNHWDNLNRMVERGYAGASIWDWHKLPEYLDPRYIDYARANASIGINGTVITNVNSNALVLTTQYLKKLVTLADAFRPYGIKVYLTARFSAPVEIGGMKSADPLTPEVQEWWNKKADEIYSLIPNFGGFLVKANSEGQPGPQDYNRTHAEGANMLADALAPHKGIVMWRAFVYSHEAPDDRAKQAYNEFKPLDGKFRENVMIQVKNGAIDFQPREPFHPLFGATPSTPLIMEFQVTQEYTGCATHLFFQAPLYKEVLNADTYAKGKGSTVAKVIDGSLYNNSISGMAGVSNIGSEINWCGHPFAQANWYALGRLAWNHKLSSEQIADEWLKMTFSLNKEFVETAKKIMIESRESLVNYMTPLGLHHMMAWNHHYGPGPWVNIGRADWTSVYYHQADDKGIGFNRSTSGSDAVSQYSPEVKALFNNVDNCPEEYLLWFHHVAWDKKMKSGQTLWNEMCYRYHDGANWVVNVQKRWSKMEQYIDKERFDHVTQLLKIQAKEAKWWRDACLLYFQQFSKQDIPAELEQPEHNLQYFIDIEHRFVPGIKNE